MHLSDRTHSDGGATGGDAAAAMVESRLRPVTQALGARPDGRALQGEPSVMALLDAVPNPILLLAADRSVLLLNAAAKERSPACLAICYGRVVRFAGPASESFDCAFQRALSGHPSSAVVTMTQHRRQTLWRLHLGPLGHEVIAGAAVVVAIDPPATASGTPTAITRLFGLTAAEARVLALLLDDRCPREIAVELDIAITTVRSHLQALFSKTGTHRQSELVALTWSSI